MVGGIHRKRGGTKITSSGSDSRDPPEPPRPGPLPAKASEGKTQFVYACSQGSTL